MSALDVAGIQAALDNSPGARAEAAAERSVRALDRIAAAKDRDLAYQPRHGSHASLTRGAARRNRYAASEHARDWMPRT